MRLSYTWVILIIFQVYAGSISGQSETADSLKNLLQVQSIKEHPKIYNELFKTALEAGQKEQALNYVHKAAQLAEIVENREQSYAAMMNLMNWGFTFGQTDTTIIAGIKALKHAKKLNNLTLEARTHNQLGIAYVRVSIFDKALEHYFSSLQLIEDTLPNIPVQENEKYKALVMNNIGSIYLKMKNLRLALDYYTNALDIRRKQNVQSDLASSLQNVGVVYENLEEFNKALSYYQEALDIRLALSDESDIAELLMNIGVINIMQKDFLSAEKNLLNAHEIMQKQVDSWHLSYINNSLADLYIQSGESTKALPYIQEALDNAIQVNDKINESKAYDLLGQYYAIHQNYYKAYENKSLQLAIKDSIYSSDMAAKISEMQTKYETEKKEKEIELLLKNNEIQSLKLKRRNILIYLLILLFILSLFIVVLIINRRRLKQKNEKTEWEKKNLETEQRLIRSQMNPHFIFNSMNSIQSYISRNDSFTAMTYLSKFAMLMRYILENSRKAMISIDEEVNTLETYLQLEKIRFRDIFEYEIILDQAIGRDTTFIPPMLIQPFVENAIKHGFNGIESKGILQITFEKKAPTILCTISDNGIGRQKAMEQKKEPGHRSLGMEITKERLKSLNKLTSLDIKFNIIDLKNKKGESSGTEVQVSLPFEED